MTAGSLIDKLSRLRSSDLPQSIAPERLAETAACIEGRLELRGMTRLGELLKDSWGVVDLELAFGRDEHGLTCITGRYETSLQLVCQRCLEPFKVKLAQAINVGIAFDRTGLNKLPGILEPLVLKQETMLLAEFIEDEILLSLPMSPLHHLQDCAVGRLPEERNNTRENPFHVLKELETR